MTALKKLFISRKTIIVFIGLLLVAVTIGALLPQTFITPSKDMEKWSLDYPFLAPWANLLGLHHIYTTPAFVVILFLILISLVLSAIDQIQSSWRKTFAPATGGDSQQMFTSSLPEEEVARRLRRHGYITMVHGDVLRLVRHPWGFWGNALLHVGIMVAIASSIIISVSQQQGVINLVEGQTHLPEQPWLISEKGLLGGDFVLPGAVRLETIAYQFRPTFGVKNLSSTVSFISPDGSIETRIVAINSILHQWGLRVYQGIEFGHVFYVEVTSPTGQKNVFELLIKHQQTPEKPSYEDFPKALGGDYVLRTKYFVDEEKQTFSRENPLLIIRLDEKKKEIGQLPLKEGANGMIGDFQLRLVKISKWSRLLFVKITGIPGVFFGFFIIVLGGFLHYFTPPREILLRPLKEGCSVAWRAGRFAGFYSDEFEQLKSEFSAEAKNG